MVAPLVTRRPDPQRRASAAPATSYYWRNGSLFAVPFDLRRLEVTGSPVPVLEGVGGVSAIGAALYSFSDTGTLVYIKGGSEEGSRTLVWLDRKGQAQPLPAPPNDYRELRLSPEGQRVAVSIRAGEKHDIWAYDLARGALTRLTFHGDNRYPVWTPDGKRFLLFRFGAQQDAGPPQAHFIFEWIEEIRWRVRAGG